MKLTQEDVRSPERRPPPSTVTYYRHDGVSVTDRWLVAYSHRYAIHELRNLRALRGRRDPLTRRAGIAAGTVAAAIAITGGYLDLIGWIGAAGVLGAPVGLVAFGLLRRPRRYELWAEYRGMTVQVYAGQDPERFNQICRALVRAQERRQRY